MPIYAETELMNTNEVYEHLGVLKGQFRQYTENTFVRRVCGAFTLRGKGNVLFWPPPGVAILSNLAAEDRAGRINPANVEAYLDQLQRLDGEQMPHSLPTSELPPKEEGLHMLPILDAEVGQELTVTARSVINTGQDLVLALERQPQLIREVLREMLQPDDPLLTKRQARERYGVPFASFREIPRVTLVGEKGGRTYKYRASAVKRWIAALEERLPD